MAEGKGKDRSTNMKVRRMAENVIMVCLALIMLVSGYKVYTIVRDYKENQAAYESIAEQARPGGGGFTGDIDFAALSKINPDVIGWLYYKDMHIDYPVVKGSDNETYLSKLFDGRWGGCGTLFADCITEAPFEQFNTVVYGHHMRDGSMFAQLKKLKDPEFWKEHPQLELITPEGKYHLEIWAFLNQPSDSGIYETNINDEEKKAGYIALAEQMSDYTTDVEVTTADRLVVLSTCAYEYQDARYIVVCKMVPGQK